MNKEYVLSLSPIHILQCPSLETLSHVWWLGSTPQLNQINDEVAFESYTQAKYFWNILDRFNGQKISKRKLDIFFLKKPPENVYLISALVSKELLNKKAIFYTI